MIPSPAIGTELNLIRTASPTYQQEDLTYPTIPLYQLLTCSGDECPPLRDTAVVLCIDGDRIRSVAFAACRFLTRM